MATAPLSTQLLTLRQIAVRLHVTEATVKKWCAHGHLAFIQFGRQWRVPEADLERFVESRMRAAREKQPVRIGEFRRGPIVVDPEDVS